MFKSKKGQVGGPMGEVINIVLAIMFVTIIVAVTLAVQEGVQETQTENGTAYNATSDLIEETVGTIDWIGIIILVAIVGVIISVLMAAFYFAKR